MDEELFIPEVVTNTRHWLTSQGIDPDIPMECEVCRQPVSAWEAVYVHVVYHSVMSHLICPKQAVMKLGSDTGLNPDFDFETFLEEIHSMCRQDADKPPRPASGELEQR